MSDPEVLQPVCKRCGASGELLCAPNGSEEKLCRKCYEALTDAAPSPATEPQHLCERCGVPSETTLCDKCYKESTSTTPPPYAAPPAPEPAPESTPPPTPEPPAAGEVSAPPIIGQPKPATEDKLCQVHHWRWGKKVVEVVVPADGSPAEFFLKGMITAMMSNGQAAQFNVTGYMPGCKSVEEAFERWDAVFEEAKKVLLATQGGRPKIQVPARNLPPELFGRMPGQPPRRRRG